MRKEQMKDWIKNNTPTLLTIASSIATLATAGFGIKAGMDIADICNEETDVKTQRKRLIKACVPTVISAGVAVGCGISADIINRDQKSDLLAMCALIGSSYSGYRQEVISRFGADIDKEITDTVAKSSINCYMAPEIPDKLCHWYVDMGVPELGIFELDAYERDILHAEMHLNRNYILCGEQSVRDLLEFLDVADSSRSITNCTDMYGWAINDSEIYYIDFEHEKVGENEFKMYPVFVPWREYDHLDMFGEEY